MLLGWLAGTMSVTDVAVAEHLPAIPKLQWIAGAIGAALVLAVGKLVAARKPAAA
jgi:hypothetical protein